MTELVTLIGGRGGGKSTLVSLIMQICGQDYPDIQKVGNVHMAGCKYVDDILKFLALKMIVHDTTFMEVVIDEAALSGLESRGSGMKSLDSYLIALSRKLNVDIWLISQLMCLEKGTLIETPSGMVPIEQIKAGDEVVDNTYWGMRIKRIAATSKQLQNKILRIELESGHSINATPNHRFPVYQKRQERNDVLASDLLVGDMLKIDRWRLKRISNPLYQLLGIIHAEGSWRITHGMKETNQLHISLDKREIDLQDFVIGTIRAYRPEVHIGIRKSEETNRCAIDLSSKRDVQFFKGKYEDFLLSGGKSAIQKSSFLSGFFEGDGCVEPKTYVISLCQSESNADKLLVAENLLRDLGIPFHIYTDWRRVGGVAAEYAEQDGYVVNRLKIGSAYAGIFANTIGFVSSTKQKKLESMSDNLYARISEITEINEPTEVYDLAIEKGAPYFMANGIRSHNSMVEKRAQWLSDFYIYCKSHIPEGTRDPDYYTFEVYNEDLRLVNVLELTGKNAWKVYPLFDTEEVPFAESLAKQFASYYEITEEDISKFKELMEA